MHTSNHTEHKLLLEWLIGISVLLFILFVAWQQDLFGMLLQGDQTRLSVIILLAFMVINVHVLNRVIVLSRERNIVNMVQQLLEQTQTVSLNIGKDAVRCCDQIIPESFVTRHLRNLAGRMSANQAGQETGDIQTHLLSALDKRIRGGQKYGWMFADLMIKLGLMGTVIGFVLMLGSVASLQHYDVTTMQDLLHNMSGGMRVALFTTLSGLIAGLILGIQYQFLDRHADDLLAEIEELSEVYVLPALLNESGNNQIRN
jgi:flagellar motor component MotA